MNTYPGTLGIKLGMTQYFSEDGRMVRCTVVEAAPLVLGKRTVEKDGYTALIVGLGERKEKNVNKPEGGFFKKAGQKPTKVLRELRCTEEFAANYNVGDTIKVDQVFEAGQKVDVQGKCKGRGYSGVMRRHNFAGFPATHGTHEYKRHGGSIGTNLTPGRTLRNTKMPGQYGNETVSVLNLTIAKVIADKNLILIEGGVPTTKNGVVKVRGAVKKNGGKKKA